MRPADMNLPFPARTTTAAGMVVATLLLLAAIPANAVGPQAVYTFSVADLGQGLWGGGQLRADGSANGHVAFSFLNGNYVAHHHPKFWVDLGGAVIICGPSHVIRDTFGIGPQPFCSPVLPVTGQPLLIDFDTDGNPDLVIRVTPAN